MLEAMGDWVVVADPTVITTVVVTEGVSVVIAVCDGVLIGDGVRGSMVGVIVMKR